MSNEYEMLFAKSPAGATHIDPSDSTYLKPFRGDEWWVWDEEKLEWDECSLDRETMVRLKRIPVRETELNRWIDTYETWSEVVKNELLITNAPAITENMFYDRRALRHPKIGKTNLNELLNCECETLFSVERCDSGYTLFLGRCNHKHGLNLCVLSDVAFNFDVHDMVRKLNSAERDKVNPVLDVNGTDAVDMTDSQPEQWLPEVREECEYSVDEISWYVCKPMFYSHHAVFLKSHKANDFGCKEYSIELDRVKFRKIVKKAKARRLFINKFEFEANDLVLGKMFNSLIESGVDLSPLMKDGGEV